jgi:hypothetical protein
MMVAVRCYARFEDDLRAREIGGERRLQEYWFAKLEGMLRDRGLDSGGTATTTTPTAGSSTKACQLPIPQGDIHSLERFLRPVPSRFPRARQLRSADHGEMLE